MKLSMQAAITFSVALTAFALGNPASAHGFTAGKSSCPVIRAAKRVAGAGIHLAHGTVHLVTGTTENAAILVTTTSGYAVQTVTESVDMAAPIMHCPASMIKRGAFKVLGATMYVVDKAANTVDKCANKAIDLVPAAAGTVLDATGSIVNTVKDEAEGFVIDATDAFIVQ
jgi:hypothetical protein